VSTATIPHVTLPKPGEALPGKGPGFWLLAGTPVSEPYPCTCWYSPCTYDKCPDRLRSEGDALPNGCCGRRNAPVAEPGFVRPPRQAVQEPTSVPAHTGPREEPRSAASDRHSGARGPFLCDCDTPWDPPPPVLLIAAGKDGPIRASVEMAAKLPDVRAAADGLINDRGRRREKPWKDGRHVLLPPPIGGKAKTRPCWHAPLDDGTLAVLDTPDETGSGIHCTDCHRNFLNAGAWQLHRGRDPEARWREVCKDPATVLCLDSVQIIPAQVDLIGRVRAPSAVGQVVYGAPLLKLVGPDVWGVDALAPWGAKGPDMTRDEAQSVWQRAQERLMADRWAYGRGHNRGARFGG
jgi:hypothetical protein